MSISPPNPINPDQPSVGSDKEALVALRIEYEGINRLLESQSKAFQEALNAQSLLSLENEHLVKQLKEQSARLETLEHEKSVLEESYRALSAKYAKLERAQQPQTAPTEPTKGGGNSPLEAPIPPLQFGSLISDFAKPGSGKVSSTLRKTVTALHGALPHFVRHTNEPVAFGEVLKQILTIHAETQRSGILPLYQLAAALRIMFEDYKQTPKLISSSSLRTLGQTMDFFLLILEKVGLEKLKNATPMNILAVDDDADVLEILRSQLGALGINLVGCKDATEALQALPQQPFDLVLLDIGMAGHNGFEVCSNIRKLEGYRRTPVVFLTGLTTSELKEQSKLVGGNDFVEKPFHAAALGLKCVFWVLRGRVG